MAASRRVEKKLQSRFVQTGLDHNQNRFGTQRKFCDTLQSCGLAQVLRDALRPSFAR